MYKRLVLKVFYKWKKVYLTFHEKIFLIKRSTPSSIKIYKFEKFAIFTLAGLCIKAEKVEQSSTIAHFVPKIIIFSKINFFLK